MQSYFPPFLKTQRGMMTYYGVIIPVITIAIFFMGKGGEHRQTGWLIILTLSAVLAVAYSTWLVLAFRRSEDAADEDAVDESNPVTA